MIQIQKTDSDSIWLNREITEHLKGQAFTSEQETAITKLIQEIAYGYRHTISSMNWGPGWD